MDHPSLQVVNLLMFYLDFYLRCHQLELLEGSLYRSHQPPHSWMQKVTKVTIGKLGNFAVLDILQ